MRDPDIVRVLLIHPLIIGRIARMTRSRINQFDPGKLPGGPKIDSSSYLLQYPQFTGVISKPRALELNYRK